MPVLANKTEKYYVILYEFVNRNKRSDNLTLLLSWARFLSFKQIIWKNLTPYMHWPWTKLLVKTSFRWIRIQSNTRRTDRKKVTSSFIVDFFWLTPEAVARLPMVTDGVVWILIHNALYTCHANCRLYDLLYIKLP